MNRVWRGSSSRFIAAKQCARGFRPMTSLDMAQVLGMAADRAAQHGIDIAAPQQHGADQRGVGTQCLLGHLRRDALATHQARGSPATRSGSADRRSGLTTSKSTPARMRRPARSRRCSITSGRPISDGLGQAFVDHRLHGAQHALVLALAIDHAPWRLLGGGEHRLHDEAGVIDEVVELVAVGVRDRQSAASPRRNRPPPAPRPARS